MPPMMIYFWVKLVTSADDKYQQIMAGIERAYRKPQSKTIIHRQSTEYIQYFEEIELAEIYIGDLLNHVYQHEQQRLKGA